jgi:hypothetical protein
LVAFNKDTLQKASKSNRLWLKFQVWREEGGKTGRKGRRMGGYKGMGKGEVGGDKRGRRERKWEVEIMAVDIFLPRGPGPTRVGWLKAKGGSRRAECGIGDNKHS